MARLGKHPSAAVVAFSCIADSSVKTITIFGYRTCETWTKNRVTDSSGEFANRIGKSFDETWLLGFLSGINSATSTYVDNPLRGVDATIIFDWMDKYCAAQPGRDVSDGAVELFNKLIDLSKKKSPSHERKPDPPKGP